MNSKVLNVLILLVINVCCVNTGIVSFVKSSTSRVSNWYDYYIKPLWTVFVTQPSVPADADISFYEHDDVNYKPPYDIDDDNVIVMNFGDQVFLE